METDQADISDRQQEGPKSVADFKSDGEGPDDDLDSDEAWQRKEHEMELQAIQAELRLRRDQLDRYLQEHNITLTVSDEEDDGGDDDDDDDSGNDEAGGEEESEEAISLRANINYNDTRMGVIPKKRQFRFNVLEGYHSGLAKQSNKNFAAIKDRSIVELGKSLIAKEVGADASTLLTDLRGSIPGSLRTADDRAAQLILHKDMWREQKDTFKSLEVKQKEDRREKAAFVDHWSRHNAESPTDNKIGPSAKAAVFRAATKNLKAQKRPLPRLQIRQGDKSEYMANKNRHHPHLDLIMAQAILSPYNGSFNDSVFDDPRSTGWKGYSKKQLQKMEEVIDARLKLSWIANEVKPINPKASNAPTTVYDMKTGRIVEMESRKEEAFKKSEFPDYFMKHKKLKKRLKERFSEICEYNSPFHRIQGLVNYHIHDAEWAENEERKKYSVPMIRWRHAIRKVIFKINVAKNRILWEEYAKRHKLFHHYFDSRKHDLENDLRGLDGELDRYYRSHERVKGESRYTFSNHPSEAPAAVLSKQDSQRKLEQEMGVDFLNSSSSSEDGDDDVLPQYGHLSTGEDVNAEEETLNVNKDTVAMEVEKNDHTQGEVHTVGTDKKPVKRYTLFGHACHKDDDEYLAAAEATGSFPELVRPRESFRTKNMIELSESHRKLSRLKKAEEIASCSSSFVAEKSQKQHRTEMILNDPDNDDDGVDRKIVHNSNSSLSELKFVENKDNCGNTAETVTPLSPSSLIDFTSTMNLSEDELEDCLVEIFSKQKYIHKKNTEDMAKAIENGKPRRLMGTTQLSRAQATMSLNKYCSSPLLRVVLTQANDSKTSRKDKYATKNKTSRTKHHSRRPSTATELSSSMPSISVLSSEPSTIASQRVISNGDGKNISKRSMTERILAERPMSSTGGRGKRPTSGLKQHRNMNRNGDKRQLLASPHEPVKHWKVK